MFLEIARLKIFSDAVEAGIESVDSTEKFEENSAIEYTEEELASIINSDVPPKFLEEARGVSDETWKSWDADKRRKYVKTHPGSTRAKNHPKLVAEQQTPHTHIKGEAVKTLSVQSIMPEEKDLDRAHNLYFRKQEDGDFKRESSMDLKVAQKMSSLITDPVKLIRRTKAVINEAKKRRDNSADTRASIKCFIRRMRELEFTEDQISDILF